MRKNASLAKYPRKNVKNSGFTPRDLLKLVLFASLWFQGGLIYAMIAYFFSKVLLVVAMGMVCPKVLRWDPTWAELAAPFQKPSLQQQLQELEMIEARLDEKIDQG